MDEQTQGRAARNEALFREVNEAIARGLWPGQGVSDRVRWRCECAQIDCASTVEATVHEYEAIRREADRFLVLAGHEGPPEVEIAVERGRGFVVVEKRGLGAQIARDTDPRH